MGQVVDSTYFRRFKTSAGVSMYWNEIVTFGAQRLYESSLHGTVVDMFLSAVSLADRGVNGENSVPERC